MLIKTEDYLAFILNKVSTDEKHLVEKIFNLIENNLKCNGPCGRILPPEEFYNSSSFTNRGGKMPSCKVCFNLSQRNKYKKKK